MSDQQNQQGYGNNQRPGFNPNAASFVPNANAPAFVPGQLYQSGGMPLMPGPPPQGFYNPHMMPQQAVPFMQHPPPHYAPPSVHQGFPPTGQQNMFPGNQYRQPDQHRQAFPPQAQQFTQNNPPPAKQNEPKQPIDSWDMEADESESTQTAAPSQETSPPKEEITKPEIEVKKPEEVPKKVEPAQSKPDKPESSNLEKEKEKPVQEETVAAVASRLRTAVVIDDGRKERVNIVFIGHVDAGKSTIGGQLMYLTGMVDKRTLEKYEKEAKEKGRESWYLSWALDTNEEERDKGKTVEVGRAFFETEEKHFTILDAPGHKSFVPNMIAGATQADLSVLVISARKGEFETGFDRGGQTREHAMLVKTAGVRHMIILVNKMDDPTVEWDQSRYTEVQDKLTPYLKKLGFRSDDIFYIPCSGLTGAFLKDRPSAEVCSWYAGCCFLEYIDKMMPKMSRDFNGPIRAIIADKYSDMGTVVIGKLESGVIVKGQNVLLMPNRTTVQVLQTFANDVETDQVYAGDNIKLKIKGVEESDILPGFVVCSVDAPCRAGRVFDAEVALLELKSIICSGYSCVLHIHAAIEEVCVKKIICKIDKKTGEKVKAKFAKQDEKCIMRLESPVAFCLDTFANFPQMGRFTLRDEGRTIAIGKVVKIIE